MPFDELTEEQKQLVTKLVEVTSSSDFSSEFWAGVTLGSGWFIKLRGKGDVEDKELDYEFEETDLQELANAGYLTLIPKQSGYKASLKAKAHQQYKLFKDPLNLFPSMTELTQNQNSGIDIFISHSSKDRIIAEALINLLRDALSIPANRIRCTSVDGYRLPAGASTDEQLRQEIYDARVFLGLITPTSFQSTYVLFELGARWGARLPLAPVLASGANASTLRAPLSGLNALSCDEPAQIYQLVENIASILKINLGSPASYQKYIDSLMQESKAGKEQYQSQSKEVAVETESSMFTTSEERDFDYIYRKLDRYIEFSVVLYQQKEGEKNGTQVGEESYRTNLLRAIISYVNEGYHTFRKLSLEVRLTKSLNEHYPINMPDTKRGYSFGSIKDNLALELQIYGLAKFIEAGLGTPLDNRCEFTDKIYRFKYWLEFNSYSFDNPSFEVVEHVES